MMRWIASLFLFTVPLALSAQVPRVVLPDLDPANGEELKDPEKLAERIAKNSKSVSERLAEAETGRDTLRDQKQVKADLDALIKLLEPPPSPNDSSSSSSPPPPNSPPPPGGSSSNDPKNKKNDESKGGPPPMPKPMGGSKGGEPMPAKPEDPKVGDATPKDAAAMPGKAGSSALPGLPAEESLARDFWGHLPDAPRQQMMQFYREQYMTKYKDLLSQYYQSLAEKEKKK